MTGIQINQHDITIKEYHGERVITFKDVDLVHERKPGTAKDRFRNNIRHFIEGEDYFKIPYSEFRVKYTPNSNGVGNPNNEVVLLTESGYLMLVKSFTDDLAWKVQRQLVKSYFKMHELQQKQVGKPVVDVPENPKIQSSIEEVRKLLIAIDVMLDEYNAYRNESEYNSIKSTLQSVALKMFSTTCSLLEIRPNITMKVY